MTVDTSGSQFAKVTMNPARTYARGGLIGDRIETVGKTMIPHILAIFGDSGSHFHAVENFRIAAGESIDGLTPPVVAEFIKAHGLYRPVNL